MSNSITAPITIIQNTINAPVTLGIIGGGGGDLISGPVRATNGVSSIANGALSIAMTSGLQTALDAKQATLTNYSTISALTGYPTSFPTTPADINNVGTSKLLGRHGAGTGTAQEIGIDGGLELHGGNLRRAAVTGPVTIAAGGSVSAIADGALTISMVSELENILNSTASAEEVANKQDILVSGTNIKTVNGNSLLGSGDVTISGATFDNPSAQVGLTAINGTSSTAMRSDAAPALDQGIAPSWTAAHTFTQSIAAASTATAIQLINPTAATSGNQRWSPATVWTGQGWKTNATAASQTVAFRAFTQPVQGSTNPTGTWTLQSSINNGAWTSNFTVDTSGTISGFRIISIDQVYANGNDPGHYAVGSFGSYRFGSNANASGGHDTFLFRKAAANIRQGAADAASPIAQTTSVQNVVAGTSNTAGANRTYAGSQGTGTGVGGDHIFTVATAGTSGTSQNALVEAFRVRQDRACFVANVSAEPATPTGGGVFYVEAGALKYKGSSGTVTTIANA